MHLLPREAQEMRMHAFPSTGVPLILGVLTSENPYHKARIFYFYNRLRTNRLGFGHNCTAIVIFGNPCNPQLTRLFDRAAIIVKFGTS